MEKCLLDIKIPPELRYLDHQNLSKNTFSGAIWMSRGLMKAWIHLGEDSKASNQRDQQGKVEIQTLTPWKFNIAPENGWLEDEFPFGIPYFQRLC